MSKRTDLMLADFRRLYLGARTARAARDDLRDNYAALLTTANDVLDAVRDERDDALVRLNARLVLEGQPELTLLDFKDLP